MDYSQFCNEFVTQHVHDSSASEAKTSNSNTIFINSNVSRRDKMKRAMMSAIMVAALTATGLIAEDHKDNAKNFQFDPNSLVLSRSVYTGNASTVTSGQTLPPGCVAKTVVVPLLAGGSA